MSQKPGEKNAKTFIVAAPSPTTRNRGVLTTTSGADAGRVLTLPPGTSVTLGRSDECTYSFLDGSLSRIHARAMWLGGNYVLEDLNSTNGTYLNDQRVTAPGVLHDGDRLQLGTSTTFRFSLVNEDEEQALQRVYEASTRDGLTGLFNRKHLDERLEGEVAFAGRHDAPLSVVMLDIDFFKRINDTWGHPAGDAVIRSVGTLLARVFRTEDLAGRFGGEEFLIVLRGIPAYDAFTLAERLRNTLQHTPVEIGGAVINPTASFGVASLACCGDRPDRETLIKTVDARLYEAKQTGRNRVIGPR